MTTRNNRISLSTKPFPALLVIVLLALNVSADEPLLELTKTDITKVEVLVSTRVSLFGISLGTTLEQARERLNSETTVSVMPPDTPLFPASRPRESIRLADRREVERGGPGKNSAIASFYFNSGKVSEIVINNRFADWLVGDSRRLVLDINSRRELLGVEDLVERGVLGEKVFVYAKEGVQVQEGFAGAVIVFQPPAKRR